jgi:transposase
MSSVGQPSDASPRSFAASGTTVSQVYGAGPVVTATVIGDVGAISRFPTRDHFAAYNGTAPIEASSGNRTIHRLSRRGNRHLNHAIHMAAVSQISHHNTAGRDYYLRKIDDGMAPKSALRALKRKISDALYARMTADARRATRRLNEGGPGGQRGTTLHPARPAHTPNRQLFGEATPGSPTTLRRPDCNAPTPTTETRATRLLTQRGLDMRGRRGHDRHDQPVQMDSSR